MRSNICNKLLGIADYYEAVFTGPAAMEHGRFRSNVLGMIIEMLDVLRIDDDLRTELIRSITAGWKMEMVDDDAAESEMVLEMLESVRGIAMRDDMSRSLEVGVLMSLPIREIDLKEDHVYQVYDVMNRIMDHLSSRTTGEHLVA
ncbi:MAG: hypothetical protein NQU42_01935 [Methanothrix sp.]|uniref:hypothetical protein n=1 Tax=Methanothrix sp. TaxID=90426 RepID=UPI0025E3D97C|nr:hypothetical protein [Methanothrix sp.]MCQ8902847.1 hypothetical protein [Methanothrix sp.]